MVNIASNTTVEQDKQTGARRKINLIWEITQASIAIFVTVAAIAGAFVNKPLNNQSDLLSYAFFLIIGFYFGRTNHNRLDTIVRKSR